MVALRHLQKDTITRSSNEFMKKELHKKTQLLSIFGYTEQKLTEKRIPVNKKK